MDGLSPDASPADRERAVAFIAPHCGISKERLLKEAELKFSDSEPSVTIYLKGPIRQGEFGPTKGLCCIDLAHFLVYSLVDGTDPDHEKLRIHEVAHAKQFVYWMFSEFVTIEQYVLDELIARLEDGLFLNGNDDFGRKILYLAYTLEVYESERIKALKIHAESREGLKAHESEDLMRYLKQQEPYTANGTEIQAAVAGVEFLIESCKYDPMQVAETLRIMGSLDTFNDYVQKHVDLITNYFGNNSNQASPDTDAPQQ